MLNLVVNGAEAIGERAGSVSIATAVVDCTREDLRRTLVDDNLPAGCYVSLEVADSGVGMDPETLARVFDPFFSTKFVGRGLGLPVVLGIVRGHRGAIRVASCVGQGTQVTVLLPTLATWEAEARLVEGAQEMGRPIA